MSLPASGYCSQPLACRYIIPTPSLPSSFVATSPSMFLSSSKDISHRVKVHPDPALTRWITSSKTLVPNPSPVPRVWIPSYLGGTNQPTTVGIASILLL